MPTISGHSGSLTHGQALTLTGSSFGSKSAAAPIKYDDFEGGVDGNSIGNGWQLDPGGADPVYSNDQLLANSLLNCLCDFRVQSSSNLFMDSELASTSILYLDWWYKFHRFGASSPDNVKMFRTHNAGGVYPNSHWDWTSGSGVAVTETDPDQSEPPTWASFFGPSLSSMESWKHVQIYMRQPADPANGGDWQIWVDCSLELNFIGTGPTNGFRFYKSGDNGTFERLFIGNFVHQSANGEGAYFDHVYVDNTRARVEIGDNAVYTSCTHREIQPPTAWSATSLTVTVNRGTFSTVEDQYAFVIDSDGNVSDGFQLTAIGGGSGRALVLSRS